VSRTFALLIALLATTGCEVVDRPNKPIPHSFEAVTLAGRKLHRKDLVGRPLVISLWVPG
jgi:hypothetical protein